MPREVIGTLHPTLTAEAIPLWQRINNLFNATGWPEPGTRLRDELVVLLDHALSQQPKN